jgi:nucleotide-binding universal stress UspA family protein
MSIKTILVPLDGTDAAKPAIEMGLAAAKEFAAHVEVLHVRPNPKDAVPLLGEGMSGTMIEEMIEIAEKEAQERAHKARAMFDEYCSRHAVGKADQPAPGLGVSAGWRDETGREDEITALRGRLADLIVVGRPLPDSPASSTMTLNAALTETGRAVIVMPPGAAPGKDGLAAKVAISWNGSTEASRAVAAAMPIIERAKEVLVVTINVAEPSVTSAAEIGKYLAWHGIRAKVESHAVPERQVGEEVVKQCARFGADLLVMGAYTRSRLRRLIFGGVTQYVLSSSTVPALMVH